MLVFVAHAVAARRLGPGEFGAASAAYVLGGVVWLMSNWGGDLHGIRILSRDSSGHASQDLLRARSFAGVIAALAVFGAVFLSRVGDVSIAVAAGCYVMGVCTYPDWALRGMADFRGLASMSVALGGLMVAGVWWALPEGAGAGRFLLIVAAAYPIAAFPFYRRVFARLPRQVLPSAAAWKRIVSAARRLGASQVMASGLQLAPVWGLLLLVGPVATGVFAAAARLVQIVGTATFMLSMAFFSDLSTTDQSDVGAKGLTLGAISGFAGLIVATAAALTAAWVVPMVFGEGYSAAVPIFQLLCLAIVLLFVRNPLRLSLLAAGDDASENAAMVRGLVVNVVVAGGSIAWAGMWGAAWAVVAGEAVIVWMLIRTFRRRASPA